MGRALLREPQVDRRPCSDEEGGSPLASTVASEAEMPILDKLSDADATDAVPQGAKPGAGGSCSRRWALAAAGVAVLVLCAVGASRQPAALTAPECVGPGNCPVRSLFMHPSVHKVVADNIMQVGSHLLGPEDQPLVDRVAADVFRNISKSLQQSAPEAASVLDTLQVTDGELNAVLASLHLLCDPKVRKLGLEVGRAIRASPTPSRTYLLTHIEAQLRPRSDEIKALKAQIIPVALLSLWGQEATREQNPQAAGALLARSRQPADRQAAEAEVQPRWELTLDAANIRSMETVSGRFASKFVPRERVDGDDKRLAVLGGSLEEGRVVLNLMQQIARQRGAPQAGRLSGALHYGEGPLSWPCQMDGEKDSDVDLEKGLLCPLKFGAQGLDALKATV